MKPGFPSRPGPALGASSDALVVLAAVDAIEGSSSFVDPAAAFLAAESKLVRALSSVPDHARGNMILGYVHIMTKRSAQGIAECEHTLSLDRNLAQAHAFIGLGKIYIGHAEETDNHIFEALRLSPHDTAAYLWMNYAGTAKNHLGRWDQAVAWFRRSIEANRNHPYTHFRLAAALAQLGRPEEAQSAVKAGFTLNPNFAISGARTAWTARSDDKTYLAQLEPILDGLRKAGVREG
jgi:tetratricopeptide (TPR) repeat protein